MLRAMSDEEQEEPLTPPRERSRKSVSSGAARAKKRQTPKGTGYVKDEEFKGQGLEVKGGTLW